MYPHNVPELTVNVNSHYDESENVFIISRCVVTIYNNIYLNLNIYYANWEHVYM